MTFCLIASFAPLGLFIFIALFPGAYAPGYALFRPFGPNKETHERLRFILLNLCFVYIISMVCKKILIGKKPFW